MKTERLTWLDQLKGLAIVAVVLGHITLGFSQSFPPSSKTAIIIYIKDWIYAWHMPFFMYLSGVSYALAYVSNGKVKIDKVKAQILNLILLYLIFQSILCFSKPIFNAFVQEKLTWKEAIINLFFPNTMFWYFYVLILYYVIATFIFFERIEFKPFVFLFLGLLSILGRGIADYFSLGLVIRNFWGCFFFFFIGIFSESNDDVEHCSYKIFNKKILFMSIIIICLCSLLLNFVYNKENALIISLMDFLFSCAITYTFLYMFKTNDLNKKITMYFGKNSVVIYSTHTYIITFFKYCIVHFTNINIFSAILITTFATLAIEALIIKFQQKNKFLFYLFHPGKLLHTNSPFGAYGNK